MNKPFHYTKRQRTAILKTLGRKANSPEGGGLIQEIETMVNTALAYDADIAEERTWPTPKQAEKQLTELRNRLEQARDAIDRLPPFLIEQIGNDLTAVDPRSGETVKVHGYHGEWNQLRLDTELHRSLVESLLQKGPQNCPGRMGRVPAGIMILADAFGAFFQRACPESYRYTIDPYTGAASGPYVDFIHAALPEDILPESLERFVKDSFSPLRTKVKNPA